MKQKQLHIKINTGQVEPEKGGQVDAELPGQVDAESPGQVKRKGVVNAMRKKGGQFKRIFQAGISHLFVDIRQHLYRDSRIVARK